jgi:hypothetical protein
MGPGSAADLTRNRALQPRAMPRDALLLHVQDELGAGLGAADEHLAAGWRFQQVREQAMSPDSSGVTQV